MTIESYDSGTGLTTFTEGLNFYHWGQVSSTASNYNGVDMRGEVVLLTRNVKVVGEDIDTWGGQIVVLDVFEDTGDFRTGQLLMDSVEIHNCSQKNTFNSAVKFTTATTKHHQLTNSAISGSWAWGLSIIDSANIFVQNTAVIGTRAIGVKLQFSTNVTFDNMITGDV